MSVGLGIVCSDGIVLGVDLEYSQDMVSSPGQKLFWVNPAADYSILIAAAGNPDVAKVVVELTEDTLLEKYSKSGLTIPLAKKAIQAALSEVYSAHIDRAPANERQGLACDLVIAIRIDKSLALFRQNRTMLIQEKQSAHIGVGMYLTKYLAALLIDSHPTVEIASQILAYVIFAVSEHLQWIGKGADIHWLKADGTHDGFLKSEYEAVAATFNGGFEALRLLLRSVDDDDVPEAHVDSYLNLLKVKLLELRKVQQSRKDRRTLC